MPVTPIYQGRTAVLTTKHDKLRSIGRPLKAGLGLKMTVPAGIDTDLLGTFTGEIERKGTPKETAIEKARLGMQRMGVPLGLANEGSFGPHPLIFFIPGTQEILAFIDDELGIEIIEVIISEETNYNYETASSASELNKFLDKVLFPTHGLIVRPNEERQPSFLETAGSILLGKKAESLIFKGITDVAALDKAIQICKAESKDGKAHIETDMRAHMNPTRQRVLRKLAIKLARRLQQTCPECACPGWGKTDVVPGLPCSECSFPSDATKFEIHSCAKCRYMRQLERADGITHVEPGECPRCNP